MTSDITGPGVCIILGADNVIIDCDNFAIGGDGTGNAIYVAYGYDNSTFKNCRIENHSVGIRQLAFNNTIENCSFYNNSKYAIERARGYAYIHNSDFTYNGYSPVNTHSIYLSSSADNIEIINNTISFEEHGVTISPSATIDSLIIQNNEIYGGSGNGIWVGGTDERNNVLIQNNTIHHTGLESLIINDVGSNSLISNNNFSDNIFSDLFEFEFLTTGNNITITNNDFSHNTTGDVYFSYVTSCGSNVNFTNNNLNLSTIIDFDANCEVNFINNTLNESLLDIHDASNSALINFYWYLDVLVNLDGSPLSNANISIYNNTPSLVHNSMTGASGMITQQLLKEMTIDELEARIYSSPYNITALNDSNYNETLINFNETGSTLITFNFTTSNNPPIIVSTAVNTTSDYATYSFNFNNTVADADGDDLRSFICKDSSCSSCGFADTSNCWCNTNATPSTDIYLNCAYTSDISDYGNNSYWGKVCDESDACSAPSAPANNNFTVVAPDLSFPTVMYGGPPPIEGYIYAGVLTTTQNTGLGNATSINQTITNTSNGYVFNYTNPTFYAEPGQLGTGEATFTPGSADYNYTIDVTLILDMGSIPDFNTSNNALLNSTIIPQYEARFNHTYPNNNTIFSLGTNNERSDALGIISDTIESEMYLYSVLSPTKEFVDASCNYTFETVSYNPSNSTNSTSNCTVTIDKATATPGTHRYKLNYTDLDSRSEISPLYNESTIYIEIINATTIPTYKNAYSGDYYTGEQVMLRLDVLEDGSLDNAMNITAILKDGSGTTLDTQYIEEHTNTSTGIYWINASVPEGINGLYWEGWIYDRDQNMSSFNTSNTTVYAANANMTISVISDQNPALTLATGITINDWADYWLDAETKAAGDAAYTKAIRKEGIFKPTISTTKATIQFYDITLNQTENNLTFTINESYQGSNIASNVLNPTDAIGLESFNYPVDNITIYIPNSSLVDTIWKCDNWTSFDCTGTWSPFTTNFQSNATHIWFNTTSFSAYAGGENSTSQLIVTTTDGAGPEYPNDNVALYANYSNVTDYTNISDGNCTVRFNITSDFPGETYTGPQYNLTYVASRGVYQKTDLTFTSAGEYSYNVSCTSPSFNNLTAQDSITITAVATGGGDNGGGEGDPDDPGDDDEEEEEPEEEEEEEPDDIQDKLDDLVDNSNPITNVHDSGNQTIITLEDGSKAKFYYKNDKPVLDLDLSGETIVGDYRSIDITYIPNYFYIAIAMLVMIMGTASSIYVEKNRFDEDPNLIVERLEKTAKKIKQQTKRLELIANVAKKLTEEREKSTQKEYDTLSSLGAAISKSKAKLLKKKSHIQVKIKAKKKIFTPTEKAGFFTDELIAGIRQLESELSKISRKDSIIRYNALIDLSSSLEGRLTPKQLTKINEKLIKLRKVIFYR